MTSFVFNHTLLIILLEINIIYKKKVYIKFKIIMDKFIITFNKYNIYLNLKYHDE